nr:molybdopterin-dependent oxidoreductase [Roseomonas rosea]
MPGFCTLCRSRCGTWNTVEDGRLVKVEANPAHPTGRAICAKGRAAPEIAHGSWRLATPLRRTTPKTSEDPGWEPITWDAALAEIAGRLGAIRAESGAEAVGFAVTSPSGTPMADSIDWVERFIRVFGSPNTAYATEICNWHKDHAHAFTFGAGIGTPDYANSDLILLWGHNPASTWLAEAGEIAEARARGAALVVVDPRRNAHAAGAQHWLRVRPGTDAALALGLIHLMLAREGYDEAFLREWTDAPFLVDEGTGLLLRAGELGLEGPEAAPVVLDALAGTPIAYDAERPAAAQRADRFALRGAFTLPTPGGPIRCRPVLDRLAEACAAWTPARVSAVTTIPEASIRAAADAIGQARRVSYYCWTGVGQNANATQTDRAIAILYALTGSLDRLGGNRHLARQPVRVVNDHGLLPPGQAAKALGIGERPLGPPARGWVTAEDLRRAILEGEPYRVRGLMSFGANLLISQADPAHSAAALRALEFHVHCDLNETPTARFADILLPVSSPWEREGLRIGFEINAAAEELIQLRPRMVEPLGEARSDMEIVFALATRLGMGEAFFGGSVEAGWNHMLAPTGITVAELRASPAGLRRPLEQRERRFAHRLAEGQPAFATPSGRVELYSERLLRHGQPALPGFRPPEAPDPAFPFILTTAKSGYYCHSQHRGIASLRRRAAEPVAEMHPELARAQGIADGGWMQVETRAGRARFRARWNDALHPEVVLADYGWWEACPDLGLPAERASNYNALIDTAHTDAISGSVSHKGVPCTLRALADTATPWPGFRPLRVMATERETEDVVSLRLAAPDGAPLPPFLPGQHLTLRLAEGSIIRSYSLSDAPGGDYRITVRRAGGPGSDWVTRRLAPGDLVEAGAPSGRFVIPSVAPFPVVLVAAGIGITPFIGYLESLLGRPAPPRVVLHYGNRDGTTHAFRNRLRALAAQLPGLEVIDHYSRPRPSDRGFHHAGRIGAASIGASLIEARARFYLCGPPGMLQAVAEGLVARGVPRFEIFQELFQALPSEDAAIPDTPREVRFARSGRTLRWHPADGALLDLAEAHGLQLPSGCRVGQCESCAVPRIAGQVRHLVPLAAEDPDTCLTCRAVPLTDLVLDA